jgi:DNA-binding transcriptional regulator GbsR (MarR family)
LNIQSKIKKNYINKNNFAKKKEFNLDFIDLSNPENKEKIERIDDEINLFINKIIELKNKTNDDLEKKKRKFIENIRKEIYNENKFKNFVDEENFKKISEHINVIPTPPKITDEYFVQENKKPEQCNYCGNMVTGIFTKCDKCNFYVCQDCYQILSTTFFHQHPLIIERNSNVIKPFNAINKNEAKELKVREKDKVKKIEIKMKNTGMNLWEKDKIKLALTEDSKNKYNQ